MKKRAPKIIQSAYLSDGSEILEVLSVVRNSFASAMKYADIISKKAAETPIGTRADNVATEIERLLEEIDTQGVSVADDAPDEEPVKEEKEEEL